MKRFYTILILLIGVVTIKSQAQASNDPEAKKVLDAVSTKFKTFKTVKATFTYKVENTAGKVLSSKSGSVFMKGTKYRVTIVGQEIFCDGTNVWTYDKAANEVTISKLDNGSNTLTPQKLFTNFYDKDFLYKLNGEKKQGTKTMQEIEMTPTDKSKPFHKVYLYVDKAAKTLSSTKVLEKSGDRYSYIVNSLTPNTTIDDKQFVFDAKKYPGVEVVDLR
ncbi:MAG TPA: outer membrane lipoprotein carrier protein LolA [Chitinophagaceae bacterium]|nr:outer membrane lipoprotein carrier protein LolA [Chitinophagaceae bacterium]